MERYRTTFNPGPSRLAPGVVEEIREIAGSGLLEASHRSGPVKERVREAVQATRRALGVPDDYTIVLQPSATASMELIVRNLTPERTVHFVGGAFAERFAATAQAVGARADRIAFPWSGAPDPDAPIPEPVELVTITQSETSTGGFWPETRLRRVSAALAVDGGGPARADQPLLAVDATSSLGGVELDFRLADLWFASVQKALGLPAGLALVIVSPRAMARVEARAKAPGRPPPRVAPWQHLPTLAEKIETGQTVETPNLLGIALLGRRMARFDRAAAVGRCRELGARVAAAVESGALEGEWFVQDPSWRSPTVHNLVVPDPAALHARAAAAGFVLGAGYGPLKEACIRIATFPSHPPEELDELLSCLAEPGRRDRARRGEGRTENE